VSVATFTSWLARRRKRQRTGGQFFVPVAIKDSVLSSTLFLELGDRRVHITADIDR